MKTTSSPIESRLRAAYWTLLGISSGALGACVSTSLDVPPEHPANPSASAAPIPAVGRALRDDFDPEELDPSRTTPVATAPPPGAPAHANMAPKASTDGGTR